MAASFTKYLKISLEMRLFPALITLWSDRESALACWRDAAAPLVEDLGFTAISASLLPERRGQTPTQALLASMTRAADPDVSTDTAGLHVDQAIDSLLDRWWKNEKSLVLFLEGLEKWRPPLAERCFGLSRRCAGKSAAPVRGVCLC